MNVVTKAEVLADHTRLLESDVGQTGLRGIVTTDTADGVLYVLSRYEDNVWTLPAARFPRFEGISKRNLKFQTIQCPNLRAEVKHITARLIWSNENFAGNTIVALFHRIVAWANWLKSCRLSSHAEVTPLIAARYVEYVRGLKGVKTPESASPRFRAVEVCWDLLRDTEGSFDHPWPESSAGALAKRKNEKRPKTLIIPDEVLAPLFQYAESQLAKADELLEHRDAVAGLIPKSKHNNKQVKEKTHFLNYRGWSKTFGDLKKDLVTLRDCCFLIILTTTGIRIHELANIRRGGWYSEVKDGERFYFLGSRSDKTYEGETNWLCPEIAITAVKALERLSEPLQDELELVLESARKSGDFREISRTLNISGCIGLSKVTRNNNRISLLGNTTFIERLQKLTSQLNLDWKLAPHQFRRTFANYVVHHKLGDLRYLRDHFKHWSLEMTALYAMNEQLDLDLFDEIYAAFDSKRQSIVGHWLEPDTKLSGGMASHIIGMRSRTDQVRTYKDRREMVRTVSEQVFLRSTGIAWCTNDTGLDCAGGVCDDCEHGCIDESHKPFWEGLYKQQIELRQIDDCGEAGSKTVERTIKRCEKVLTDLGVNINKLRE